MALGSTDGLSDGELATFRQLLDRDAIAQAKYQWARAADASDADRMVERFVEDCTAVYEAHGQPIVGREALRQWNVDRLAHVTASSHHVSNIEVRFDGPDNATAYSYLHSWQHFDDYPETPDRTRYARYVDTWVRKDGVWWQKSLRLLVAGEWNFAGPLRFGEYRGYDEDIDGVAPAPR